MRRRLHSEGGFSLVELIVASAIGMVVLFGAFQLIDRATASNAEIAQREDALKRGNFGMERATMVLRSQVCLTSPSGVKPPISIGTANSITFFADLGDGSRNIAQYSLTFDPTARTLVQTREFGVGTYPELTFPGTSINRFTLLRNVGRYTKPDGTVLPFLTYYAFDNTSPTGFKQITGDLTPETAVTVVKIGLNFQVLPDIGGRTAPASRGHVLQDTILVRSADISSQTGGPRCLI